jgi:hypothetical protein
LSLWVCEWCFTQQSFLAVTWSNVPLYQTPRFQEQSVSDVASIFSGACTRLFFIRLV